MKLPILLCLLSATALVAADPATATPARPVPPMDKFRLGSWEDDIGYRQAARVGDTLYISGIAAAGAMPDAIKSVYGELQQVLAHYGLTFAHVVKENAYTTDLEALKASLAVRRAVYGRDFPASTWVQVSRLYEPAQVLEVELIAVFPSTGK
jgi:enamine deaminase RidA (YjgF/YER057c/UK114 family)